MKAQIASELQQTVTEQAAKSSNEQLTKEQIAAEQEQTFTEQAAKFSVELLTKGQIAGEQEQTSRSRRPSRATTLTKEETVPSDPPSGEKGELFERPSDDHCEVCGHPFDPKFHPRSICKPAECLRCLGDWVAGCSSGDTHDDRKRRKRR